MDSKKKPKRLKVVILVHQDLVPPTRPSSVELADAPWRAEYDVSKALKSLGHEVMFLGVYDDLGHVREALDAFQPDIAFNLLEEFAGEAIFDQNIVAYLELKAIPYTGCNPRGMIIARHKSLAKKILSYHRILTPKFEVFQRGHRIHRPKALAFPLIVKSLTEEASLGISQTSIVHNEESFQERVRFIHENIQTDALAESYIEGRELYVSVLGNRRIEILPVWELVFRKPPEHFSPIATQRVKFNPEYRKKYGITSHMAHHLSEETVIKLTKLSKRIYKILGLNGYARLDFRMSPQGQFYLLEANPNPHIGREEDLAQAALKAGWSYPDLIQHLLTLGLRWQPQQLSI